MTASLLPLDNGGCSLEFGEADLDRVRDALRARFGTPTVERHATLTVYRFAQAALTFQNEWDAPCLVASDAAGAAMLRLVADALAGKGDATG